MGRDKRGGRSQVASLVITTARARQLETATSAADQLGGARLLGLVSSSTTTPGRRQFFANPVSEARHRLPAAPIGGSGLSSVDLPILMAPEARSGLRPATPAPQARSSPPDASGSELAFSGSRPSCECRHGTAERRRVIPPTGIGKVGSRRDTTGQESMPRLGQREEI